MYDGHICTDHNHTPRAAELPDITALINNQIRKVYLEKLKAGDIDADTWKHNTEQMWKAVQEGWEKAPQFFSKAQLSLLELRRNVNTYAAFKNHANVIDLTQLLTGPDGEKISFSQFKKLAQPLSEKYNLNWLKAEYDLATKAARSAAQWETFQQRGGKLEYMTIGDGRVREAHRELEGTILPVDAPFWKLYYPPNGWNCRCFVRWRPDSTETVNPKSLPDMKDMFLNNVGLTSQVFTDDHPFIREIGEAQAERIRASAKLSSMRWERKFVVDTLKENLKSKEIDVPFGDGRAIVRFTTTGIKEAVNQNHDFLMEKNVALLNIEKGLREAVYLGSAPSDNDDKNIVRFHYLSFEMNNMTWIAVVKELFGGEKHFYSIIDKMK